jgi:hypothetical protein
LALCTFLKTATAKEKWANMPELLHNAYISLIVRIYLKLHQILIFVFSEFHTHQHKKSMYSIDMVNILKPGTWHQGRHVTRSSTARTQALGSCQLWLTVQGIKFCSLGIIAML